MRVNVKRWRNRQDMIGVCGHRLKSIKGRWLLPSTGSMGGECPKCSKPEEPAPAPRECHSPHAKWGNWRFCPLCGVALTTEGA